MSKEQIEYMNNKYPNGWNQNDVENEIFTSFKDVWMFWTMFAQLNKTEFLKIIN